MDRRSLLRRLSRRLAAATLLACVVPLPAQAQEAYPSRPIRLVVPVAAGGMTDIVARLVGQKLGERLQQPVVIDNRVGAGGGVGAEAVARAKPDGYTLMFAYPAPLVVNPYVFGKLGYDPAKDFAPVSLVASYPMAVAVHPSLPVRNLTELIALAKKSDKRLTYGSAGIASTAHLATELFRQKAGIEMVHVPYKGAAPAMNDLIGGNLQLVFDSLTLIMPQHEAGRIRALAVTSKDRVNAYPNLPAVAEAGLPDYEVIGWYGVVAPAGTPADVMKRLSTELAEVVRDPAVNAELTSRGMKTVGSDASGFDQLIRRERETWRRLVQESGIKAE